MLKNPEYKIKNQIIHPVTLVQLKKSSASEKYEIKSQGSKTTNKFNWSP